MSGVVDILGHAQVIEHLWSRVRDDALHHAYLFEGPEGIGKRMIALRLAQAANCESPEPPCPCGQCKTCRAIAAGNHPDVVLLEPEPGRATPIITVAQIREMIRKTGYHRYAARRRFVIVDPAEAMPPAAANALLKTLEEPPDGTGFVLIASRGASLLPTIVSRCQPVRFAALDVPTVAAWLEARGESDALARARLSMGCPGLALSLTAESLEARQALRDKVFRAVGRGELDPIFELSREICSGGRPDWAPRVELLMQIIEALVRDASVWASGAEVEVLDEPRLAERAAGALWPHGVTRMSRALDDARAALELNAAGRTVVDALLVRLSTELGKI